MNSAFFADEPGIGRPRIVRIACIVRESSIDASDLRIPTMSSAATHSARHRTHEVASELVAPGARNRCRMTHRSHSVRSAVVDQRRLQGPPRVPCPIDRESVRRQWNAATWVLVRRFPHDVGRKTGLELTGLELTGLELTGLGGGPIEVVAKTCKDYPFLANDDAREGAAVSIEVLARHEARQAVERAEEIVEASRDNNMAIDDAPSSYE